MATARKTTTKTTKSTKATAAPVTREELTQITKALTALAKEVKSLKAQLEESKKSSPAPTGDLEKRLRAWASDELGGDKEKLLKILDSGKIY